MTLLALVAVGGACGGYAVWQLTSPETLARTRTRLYALLGDVWTSAARAGARNKAETLGWPVYRVPAVAAVMTLVFATGLALLSPDVALAGLLPSAAFSWFLAVNLLDQNFAAWQSALMRGLPGLITTLRVHLSLGRTVPDALREAVVGAAPELRRELILAVADMTAGTEAKTSLVRLAERVGTREWAVFADTVAQAWDSDLSGSALAPLVDLMRTVTQKEHRLATARLDRIISLAPGLALLAAVLLAAGYFVMSALSGGGL